MKKILVLGGGQAQLPLIKKAKEMGLFVIVVGIKGEYPGYEIADKVFNVDIYDKESVLEIAKKEKINGVSMVCSDFGLATLGYINDQLNLCGLSEKSAIDSSNKWKMKQLLLNNNVKTAKYCRVESLEDVLSASKTLSYPLIVKAVDLQGSRGIYICSSEKELLLNYKKSIEESRENYCIVEEYIKGEEFGAQAFISHGSILFVIAHGDEVKKNGVNNVPVGHFMPYIEGNDSVLREITEVVEKAIIALGFDNCAVNVDLIMKEGVPYVIELTGRAGANFLPEVTSYFMGLDYYEVIIKSALGECVSQYIPSVDKKKNLAVLSKQIYSEKSGVVEKISIQRNNDIKILELFVKEGDCVRKFSNSRDCIGKCLCVSDTLESCQAKMNSFISNDFVIEIS